MSLRRPTAAGCAWPAALWLLAVCAPVIGADTAAPPEAVELETVRVIEKRPDRADPFAFRPLFDPDANRFQRYWNEPPSVEDVSMNGGYLVLGINRGLLMAAQAVSGLPGWKHQVQPAAARPPPLDPEQAARAARLREAVSP